MKKRREKTSTRSVWTRPWMLRRKFDGAFYTIPKELKKENSDGCKGYVRMDVNHFDQSVELLKETLAEQDTNMRDCIKPQGMCCVMPLLGHAKISCEW